MYKDISLSSESLSALKSIAEKEWQRTFSDDEVRSLGSFLVAFFSKLADNTLGIGHE